jgi:hypothetical protein
MLNRKIILALTALISLGAAVVPSTSAFALGGHGFGNAGGGGHSMGGHSMGGHVNFGGGHGFGGGNGFGGGHIKVGGPNLIRPPIFVPHWPRRPGIFVRWPHPRPTIWWTQWHRPHYTVDEVVTERVVAPTTLVQKTTDNCNCLTKEYMQDGSVLFKDICTKEAAIATPDELRAQAQGVGPQTSR